MTKEQKVVEEMNKIITILVAKYYLLHEEIPFVEGGVIYPRMLGDRSGTEKIILLKDLNE